LKLPAKIKKLKNFSPKTLKQMIFLCSNKEEALKFAPGHEKVTNVMR
jgi:hypothetical protein